MLRPYTQIQWTIAFIMQKSIICLFNFTTTGCFKKDPSS